MVGAVPREAIIEINSLFKRFGSVTALRDLTFKVRSGVTGFIGPNGAGKTTTIKILLGLIKPSSGSAKVFGMDCWEESIEVRRRVGFVHEKVAFYEDLTGIKYLMLVSKLKGLEKSTIKAEEALELVELEDEAQYRQIKGYSAGMRQRLALAQALIGRPELIILDEPTKHLDPLGRIQLRDVIQRLNREEKISFFISSHVLSELEKVCDYMILIHEGKVLKEGSLNELFEEFVFNTFRIRVNPMEPLIELLRKDIEVEKVWVDEAIHVTVKHPEKFKQELPKLVSEANLTLEEFVIEGRELESLFKKSVSRGR